MQPCCSCMCWRSDWCGGESGGGVQGGGADPEAPRKRVLRGRNEREWPEVAPAQVSSAARIRDPTAAVLSDPYTISGRAAGPQPRSAGRAAEPGAAAALGGDCEQRSGSAGATAAPSMPRETVQRLAAKAPVLPAGAGAAAWPACMARGEVHLGFAYWTAAVHAGDYLRLWESYEAQMEFVQQHMRQGQVYSHWGRVDDDVQLERGHIEALLAQRAVFHDSLEPSAQPPCGRPDAAPAPAPAPAARRAPAQRPACPAPTAEPQTAAEFRAAARDHNMSVLARAGRQELGQIDGAAEGAKAGKKRGREEQGGLQKLRGVMRKMSRAARL